MHKLASFNGKVVNASDTPIGALSPAALYGRGIFTTCRIHNGNAFLWEKHARRLQENWNRIGVDVLSIDIDQIAFSLDELIRANSVESGRARITIFDEAPAKLWPVETDRTTSVVIITGGQNSIQHDPRVGISSISINSSSPLSGIKSCNYLEHLLALKDANDQGLDEAIRTNEHGEIASACMANVFWLKNGELFTPNLATGCLPGTTREYVLENLACSEVKAGIDELQTADAVFLTSAGIGIVQVSEFEGRRLDRSDHDILNLIPISI